jgi:hypothetical protein
VDDPLTPVERRELNPDEQRLYDLYTKYARLDLGKAYDILMKRGEELRQKYANARDYSAYHIMIGSSSVQYRVMPHCDFPGDDSVEQFLTNLIAEDEALDRRQDEYAQEREERIDTYERLRRNM